MRDETAGAWHRATGMDKGLENPVFDERLRELGHGRCSKDGAQ